MKGADDPARLLPGLEPQAPVGFQELWYAWLYWTKEASGTARSAHRAEAAREYLRLKKKRSLPSNSVLVLAIEAQTESARWQAGVIPDLRTWLHQERWEDDPVALTWNGNGKRGSTNGPPAHLSKEEKWCWWDNYWSEHRGEE